VTDKAYAKKVARNLTRDLVEALDEEAKRIRARLTKIEAVKRGDTRLRPITVQWHEVPKYEVREHTRWIVDTEWRKARPTRKA
jgi:hypothetical protein